MRTNKSLRFQLKIQHGVFVFLLLLLFILLGFLATEIRSQWDVSQNGRNTLSQTSIGILEKMTAPVHITAYVTEQHVEFGDVREIIHNFIQLYQRIKPDISLTFIDPAEHPDLAREAGVQVNGELVIEYQNKQARLTTINEQVFTQTLLRLSRPQEKLILALTGHGERGLDGMANYDLGEFGRQLQVNGFVSETLNLTVTPDIPIDTDMLLIASPQTELLPGEVDKLLEYIDNGGNLLWLIDRESLRGLMPLAEKLHLILTPGVVIDPQAEQLKAPVTFALGTGYGKHAITHGFNYITVFPFARQINFVENEKWRVVPLVDVAHNGWVKHGSDDDYTFNPQEDAAGPVTIAVALSRFANDREQRVIVVGSGHFLANMYLGNGNNLDFGINLFNWLSGDEEMITIQPRATLDSHLILTDFELTVIVVFFLLVLPFVFLLCGVIIWWRRKKMT
ncbi:GldG family protein [Nitrosomonas marina]|uniref:CRISPR-associated DxTHG motif protein n=1 Tax=Nitrosomonas marina TaxID=917 RepID=A0A1H8CET9_9PROT|nr:GldG family protein [Nitrosomonas marina]SEM93419.1 CRISPR-associated DxTHG motif protein [Nitrosomonas marina]